MLNQCQDIGSICIWLDFGHDFDDFSLFIDEESCADNAHTCLSIQFLFLPDTVCLDRLQFGIG